MGLGAQSYKTLLGEILDFPHGQIYVLLIQKPILSNKLSFATQVHTGVKSFQMKSLLRHCVAFL